MNARGRGLSGILFLPCYPLFIFLIWFGCLFLPCSAFTRNPVAFKLKTKRRKSKCRHNATSVLLWRKEGREGREKPWTKNTNKRVEEGGGHVKGEISTVNSQWKEGGRILFLLARRDFVLCITVGLCTVERLRYQGNSSLPFCPSPLFFSYVPFLYQADVQSCFTCSPGNSYNRVRAWKQCLRHFWLSVLHRSFAPSCALSVAIFLSVLCTCASWTSSLQLLRQIGR